MEGRLQPNEAYLVDSPLAGTAPTKVILVGGATGEEGPGYGAIGEPKHRRAPWPARWLRPRV
jgi:hypothetical protein